MAINKDSVATFQISEGNAFAGDASHGVITRNPRVVENHVVLQLAADGDLRLVHLEGVITVIRCLNVKTRHILLFVNNHQNSYSRPTSATMMRGLLSDLISWII